MNRNKFKVLLCCYTMGIAGCNKIGNPSYMDGGGDRKDESIEKRQKTSGSYDNPISGISGDDGSSTLTVTKDSSIDCHKIVNASLKSLKEDVDMLEESANEAKKSLDYAKKRVEHTERSAENMRRVFDQAQSTSQECSQQIVNDSLKSLKEQVDMLEESANEAKKDLDYAENRFERAKKSAENMRRIFKETEESRPRFGEGDASS